MKRVCKGILLSVFLFTLLPLRAQAAANLVPVGKIVGLQLRDDTVTVAAYDDVLGGQARDAGLKIGDEIVKIDGAQVSCAEDVRSALAEADGEVALTVRRGGKLSTVQLTPEQTDEGPRLGVYLRQGIAGIGTITFYDPATGVFGALGHGVSDSKGQLLRMTEGRAYSAEILSVKKGRSGEAGQLKGSADGSSILGNLLRNTPQGVFGKTGQGWPGEPVEAASYGDVHTGAATIRSTVSGDQVHDYSVEILKIYPETRTDGRNFLLKVDDPDLLAATGGIVQGMSGSPILQDGRLVGAVTHVLVNDPTVGYGIYIGNMLGAAA